jgi:L-amino acid N-acyltransferase YncA
MFSCNQKNAVEMSDAGYGMQEEAMPQAMLRSAPNMQQKEMPVQQEQDVVSKKIIKDGRIGVRVTELEQTKSRIDSLLKIYRGYYANESFSNTDWESSYVLRIRIPADDFDKFVAEIKSGKGEILYQEIDSRDVTDQFIDLETRLENKRSYLKRYADLLQQAKTIKEILDIEERIRVLEEEIESTTGRLKYLSNQVDLSTLNLTISKRHDFKYSPEERDSFWERLKQSLTKGWFGLVDIALFMVKIWPLWIVLVLAFYLRKKYRKNKRQKA